MDPKYPHHDLNSLQWGVNQQYTRVIHSQNSTFIAKQQPESIARQAEIALQTYHDQNSELANRLQQIKGEHQLLKGIKVDEELISSRHHHRATQSNSLIHSSHKSKKNTPSVKHSKKLNSSSSVASMKKHKILTKKEFAHPSKIIDLEKHQLEIHLNSTMRKLEDSLSKEIELKTKIHELETQLIQMNNQEGNIAPQNEIHREELQSLHNDIFSLKNKNRELIEKIGKLEGEKASLSYELERQKMRNSKQGEYILAEKMKFETSLLEYKKTIMEHQINNKEYQFEINRLKSALNNRPPASNSNLFYEERIKQLEAHLQNKSSCDPHPQKDSQHSEKLSQLLNRLTIKLAENSQHGKQHAVKQQLNILKEHILTLNSQPSKKPENYPQLELQRKLMSLERSIIHENKEKEKFMHELQSVIKELQANKKMFDDLNDEYQHMKNHLNRKIRELEVELANRNSEPFQSDAQLKMKVSELEEQILRMNNLLENSKAKSKRIEQELNEEMRNLRNRLNMAEIEAKRNENEKALNSQLSKREIMSEKQAFNYNLTQSLAEKDAWKQQFGQLKQKYDNLWIKHANMENQKIQLVKSITTQRQEESKHFKQQHEREMENLHNKYNADLQSLTTQINRLKETSEEESQIIKKYGRMEAEVIQLRKLCANTNPTRTNILHLWQIKEVQYGNIHSILHQIKSKAFDLPSRPNGVQKIQNGLFQGFGQLLNRQGGNHNNDFGGSPNDSNTVFSGPNVQNSSNIGNQIYRNNSQNINM